jgi:hypothetical protein
MLARSPARSWRWALEACFVVKSQSISSSACYEQKTIHSKGIQEDKIAGAGVRICLLAITTAGKAIADIRADSSGI